MNTVTNRVSRPPFNRDWSSYGLIVFALVLLVFVPASTRAAQLIWDPLFNTGTNSGSGNWDTTAGNTNWFNGTTDVAWSQAATNNPSNGAIFNGPDAAPGTYQITNDSVQVAISNMQVNANGYVFNGSNAIYVHNSDSLSIAAGKTATFNCNMAGNGTSPFWQLGSNAVMNVTGSLLSSQQLRLVGASNSAFNLSGPASTPAIFSVLGPVNITGGSLIPTSSTFIGYENSNIVNGITYTSGALSVSGSSTIVTINGNILIIGRQGGTGTLNVSNGTVSVGNLIASRNLAIDYDGSAGSSGTVNMSGGTLNVGSTTQLANQIALYQTGASAGSSSTMNHTGGTINTWGGIIFGFAPSGTFSGGTATWTTSGGTLYVGAGGISRGSLYTSASSDALSITLSGGTVGALANWSSSLPMTLGTANGNITFQSMDGSSNPFTISLSGPLTGSGGLYVTGIGTLALSGANNYLGSTVVSNGTLSIITGPSPITNGPVTIDGTAASPTVSVTVTTPGQYWTNNGAFTFQNGTTSANFVFGALAPSTAVAPIQVNGNVAFSATPNVNVSGAAIATGTYPLIKYTGTVSGTMPTTPAINLSGGSAAGYLTNLTGSKTISLVVTSSTYNPALSWRVGNGVWDINTTSNWTQFGNPAKYTDGNAVTFDDSASGPSPVTVTLNTIVNPLNVTFNNAGPTNYTISGSGSITGSGTLSVLNSGSVTLGGTNAYTGGTVVSAGQLNINNGGNAGATAIGTGPLILNSGAAIDNTSGSDITLQASISETWNGNFTYVGSANNFNTGAGSVLMNNPITISNGANNLTIGSGISDNGLNYKLSKTGNGALTLPVGNAFGGGLAVSAGTVNLGDPNAAGSGIFTITGGAFDNISGAEFALTPASTTWGGNFSFLGSTNMDIAGPVSIPNGLGNITMTIVTNSLTTFGDIINNNTTVIKTGNGTWLIRGSSGSQSLGLTVNAGVVVLDKSTGQAITGGNNVGLTVQAGALVIDSNSFQIHSDSPVPLPVNLSGGTWDLNGFDENVDLLSLSSGSTLRMGATNDTSTLNLISGHTAQLTGTNCQFDVASNGFLVFQGTIGGSGSLVKIGAGTLNLISNNVYTGDTIISNGTIALPNGGTISNTDLINLAATNSALDLTSNNSPTFTLLAGQTLSGFGSVTGLVQTASGSVLAPGSGSAIGTLTITGVAGTNVLGGTTSMKLNKTTLTSDQVSASGGIVYGGTLALSNLSGTLTNGDSFTLFSAGGGLGGTFASITPSTPGAGLAWNTNNLAVNGTLAVMTGVAPTSPKITGITLSGTTLSIHGTNGTPNASFLVLASTNITATLASWAPVYTNAYDTNGNFNISFTVTNLPRDYFVIKDQ